MKIIAALMLTLLCFFSPSLIANPKAKLITEPNEAALITRLYKEVYEKKDLNQMENFFSKQLSFQVNLDSPVNYESLKNHLAKINQECVTLRALPFDKLLIVDNQAITLYTQTCTDKFNRLHKKRIMAITEFDKDGKVLKIYATTNSNDK